MSMHIISPGMLTTVQDLGRRGYMASGFQQGGAMDQFAARAANILLDNSESDGVLEMTLLGVKAYFDEDNVIAITGAEFAPTVTDSETGEVTELPMNCAVRVKKAMCSIAGAPGADFAAISPWRAALISRPLWAACQRILNAKSVASRAES